MKPRFAITKYALHGFRQRLTSRPKLQTAIDLTVAKRALPLQERGSLEDALHAWINYGTRPTRKQQAALDSARVLRCPQVPSRLFADILPADEIKDIDAYGGFSARINRRWWRVLDTYGDESEDRGADRVYTLCATWKNELVVADIYWDFEHDEYRVRNEAKAKLEAPVTTISKRAFYYYPLRQEVTLRIDYDKRMKVKVQ